jgi:16S rRNA (cytosine967-C5)-methyltransferase
MYIEYISVVAPCPGQNRARPHRWPKREQALMAPRERSASRGPARPPGTAAAVLYHAARAFAAVLGDGASIDAALAEVAGSLPEASLAPAIRAVALGACRWHFRLAPAVLPLLAKSAARTDVRLRALLVVAVHQLEYSSHPPATTVAAAVDAARLLGIGPAAGMVNAVLRRYLRERTTLLAAVDAGVAGRSAHPQWLVAALRKEWPADLEAILATNNAHPPFCLRVDTGRVDIDDYLAELEAAQLHGERVAGVATAVVLDTAPPLERIPGFAEGRVSVQDASAQLASAILEPRPGERILDACAAPGGKTGALLEAAGGAIELTAVDSDARRLERVAQNLARLNRSARLVHADLLSKEDWWDGQPFDAILLDAPWSGTGVIRRHPDIKLLRRASDIPALVERQQRLLANAWRWLKPGGRLLYATCSVLPQENAAVVAEFIAQNRGVAEAALPAAVGAHPGLRPMSPGWQLLPGTGPGAGADGFYYACLLKEGAPMQRPDGPMAGHA